MVNFPLLTGTLAKKLRWFDTDPLLRCWRLNYTMILDDRVFNQGERITSARSRKMKGVMGSWLPKILGLIHLSSLSVLTYHSFTNKRKLKEFSITSFLTQKKKHENRGIWCAIMVWVAFLLHLLSLKFWALGAFGCNSLLWDKEGRILELLYPDMLRKTKNYKL